MTLAELRTAYEQIVERHKMEESLYDMYLTMKSISTKQKEVINTLQKGIDAYNQENYREVYSLFTKTIAIEADADAYHNRGTTCIDLGNLSLAMHDFTAAIIFCPTYSNPHTSRGLTIAQVLVDNGALNNPQYQDIKKFAKADLQKAVELGNESARQYVAALS